jgi:hypothetical protein
MDEYDGINTNWKTGLMKFLLTCHCNFQKIICTITVMYCAQLFEH